MHHSTPTKEELTVTTQFLEAQKTRIAKGELTAAKIAEPGGNDANERAAWTILARTLLNLDESVTKN